MLEHLRQSVCHANRSLVTHGLVTLTWGNVSGFDRDSGLVVIKPSGVAYDLLQPEQMVVVDLDGKAVEGDLRPSSDTPTHVRLYRAFADRCDIAGITHTHSTHATAFAQARKALPCLGTTHADHFHGEVPVTRPLTPDEVKEAYEAFTADVIIEAFKQREPGHVPGVLVAGHAPFAWGPSPEKSVENAIALEACAQMALSTLQLSALSMISANAPTLEQYVLDKHHERKHGDNAYYGQKNK